MRYMTVEQTTNTTRPSTVTLPERRPDGVVTVFDFFLRRFPRVAEETWRERFAAGKVWSREGVLTGDEKYRPLLRAHYRREVEREPDVRGDFTIVWSDEDLIVVDKPPHLPVTPGGRWVLNCLLHLLSVAVENDDLAPLHRLDRLTSGLVVFSRNRETRSHFARLFQPGAPVEKIYTAVCEVGCDNAPTRAILEHCLARSRHEYWRQVVIPGGQPNARCEIERVGEAGDLALYRIYPHTGRKHQIRVQLADAGLPILGDPLYGSQPFHDPDNLSNRLYLDAHGIRVEAFPRPGGSSLDVVWISTRTPNRLFEMAQSATG
jgi:tRNA pseudouridine32 synthase/23S rRNA pseudouridine746 synthase